MLFLFAFQAHIEATTLDEAIDAELESVRAGSRTFIVASRLPAAEPLIDAGDCARLGALPQVRDAGGLTFATSLEVATAPGTPLLHLRGTASAPMLLDPTLVPLGPGHHYIARDAAESQGVVTPGRVEIVHPSGWRNVGPVDGFEPSYRLSSGAITLTTVEPMATVEQCWYELNPGVDAKSAADVALASLAAPTGSFVVRPVLVGESTPLELYRSRVTRRLWMLVAGFVGLLGTLVALADRRESALYRTLGTGRLGAAAIGGGEWLIVCLWAGGLGVASWSLVAQGISPEAYAAAIWSVVAAVNLGAAAALAARLALTAGSLVDQLKDRA